MTRFRVPAASLLTLLLVAANLLSQTVKPGFVVQRTSGDVELEVEQLPLGSAVTCASFQSLAAANYLLSWTGLCQPGRCCDVESAAKQGCDACPANLAAKHALVVSQLVNALRCDTTKCDAENRTIRITCEVRCGGNLTQALEACCKPLLKLVCTPGTSPCAACPLTQAACCSDLSRTAAAPAPSKTGCACGEKCACCKKACGCGADCACKEEDKKAKRRAARRALTMPPFVLPPNFDGDLPLPTRPAPMFMPAGPMPRPAMPVFAPCPVPFAVGIDSGTGNIVMSHPVPMPPPALCPPPVAPCPVPTAREEQLCAQELLQAARFTAVVRPTPRVHFETAGLEVQCERLTRLKDGRIVCEGDVCMVLRRQNQPSKIQADRIVINPEDGCFEVGASFDPRP